MNPYDLAHAELWVDRLHHERELIAAVLADPARGFDDARAAGVTAPRLADELPLVTWLAIAVRRHLGRLTGEPAADRLGVLPLVRTHMVRERTWDNERHPEELADLALSHFAYDRAFVAAAAERLLETAGRLDRLSALYDEAAELLKGAA